MDAASPDKTVVGWVGTGVMGVPMAGHLLAAGYKMYVYNRTQSKANPLISKGAVWCESPGAVAAESDVVFTMVGYPRDVHGVLAGGSGIFETLRPGGIVVDLTTSEPDLASELAAQAEIGGKFMLDAPVTGGDKGAIAGTLSVMVGGDLTAFTRVKPLLDCFGKTVVHCGAPGMGQHAKMGNQIAVAMSMIGMAEGLVYAQRAGLDLENFVKAIAGGGAGSKSIDLYASRTLSGDFQPGFFVEHFVKDLGIAVASCQRLKLCLPGLALASQLYNSLAAYGEERLGTQALVKVLERMNNLELGKPTGPS